MKKLSLLPLFLFIWVFSPAQVDVTYQKPAKEILDLIETPLPPQVRMNSESNQLVLLYRNQFKTITEMSEPELKLAGRRINPKNFSNSRTRYYNNVMTMKVGDEEATSIEGLPKEPRMSGFDWSPDEKMMAFTHTTSEGIELWVFDLESATAKKVIGDNLNGALGSSYEWLPDGNGFLVKLIPDDNIEVVDRAVAVPTGPTVAVNDGKRAQNRTYQDLLKSKIDEDNFERLIRSNLVKVTLTGEVTSWMETDMYGNISFSPNGQYAMLTTINRPFSYLVPVNRFPASTNVYDMNGNLVKNIHELPLIEDLPSGFGSTREGKRSINWRSDKPATLYYAEALDGGDPTQEVEYRDEVFQWEAPFTNKPKTVIKTVNRYSGISWGNDDVAIAYDNWYKNRNTRAYLFNPSDPMAQVTTIMDRNTQDQYANPGNFVSSRNEFGRNSLQINNGKLYLLGPGYSAEGMRPFIDEFDIASKEKTRLWRADGKKTYERIIDIVDIDDGKILTSIEAKTRFPNFYIRDIGSIRSPQQVTFFENPFKSMQSVHKELITYKRDDGVDLSGTLYLPAGYDKNSGEKLPMLMWAYPREFKDKKSAGQVTTSPHRFTYPSYGSAIFWVMRGYAVLDGAAFPIIGEEDNEPNDIFREQLVANGKAGIDAVDALGYIDRERVGVGGHSYGAFMTANLLSHSDLFAAGIARSGAYNRTLTPFGFQREERTYWEAPEIYYDMSPFMHADKMKTPLLLIHGEDDNNSGTYPLQSIRYFNALKGLGATVRLVMLPKESHGYAAKESILHMLWEQDQWMEKHVKNKHESKGRLIKP